MSRDIWNNMTREEIDEFSEIGVDVVHLAIDFADRHDFNRDETLKRLIDMCCALAKRGSLENFVISKNYVEHDEVIRGHIEISEDDEEKFHRAYNRSLMPTNLFLNSLKHISEEEGLLADHFVSSFALYMLTDIAKQGVDAVIDSIFEEMEGNK